MVHSQLEWMPLESPQSPQHFTRECRRHQSDTVGRISSVFFFIKEKTNKTKSMLYVFCLKNTASQPAPNTTPVPTLNHTHSCAGGMDAGEEKGKGAVALRS